MLNATTQQILGWTDERYAEVDARLGLLARWRTFNGHQEPVADAIGAEVDSWGRGRANHDVWLKVTRSQLEIEIAAALLRCHPDLATEPGCGDALMELGQGRVLDLDGWWIDDLGTIDFGRPIDEILPSLAEVVRREGVAYLAETTAKTGGTRPNA